MGTDYRSSEAIVDIGKRVIVNNAKRLPKVMESGKLVKYEEGDTVYREFDECDEEYEFIAKRIKALHDSGVKYSEVAVLLRKRKYGPDIAKMFDEYEIPYIIEGVNELFSTAECQAAKGIFDYLAGTIGMMELFQLWKNIDYDLDGKEIAEAIDTLNVIDVKSKKFYGEFVLQKVYHDFLRRISIVDESNSSEIILYNLGKFSQVINDFETIYYTTIPANKLSSFCNFLKYTADGYYPEGHMHCRIANPRKRPDIVCLKKSTMRAVCTDRIDNEAGGIMKPDQILIIELKRDGFEIGPQEVFQAENYVRQIKKSGILHKTSNIHAFVVGCEIGDIDVHKVSDSGIVDVLTYGHLVETANVKLFGLKKTLEEHYNSFNDESLVEKALKEPVQLKMKL